MLRGKATEAAAARILPSAMMFEGEDDIWRDLDANVLRVWRIEALINGLILAAGLFVGEFFLRRQVRIPLPYGVMSAVVAIALVIWLQVIVRRRYRSWGYSLSSTDLKVRYGILWKVQRFIPKPRIQHVDISSGPIGRYFGLVQLSVYAAGSLGAVITIPGLSPEEAEELRTALIPSGTSNG